jgi:hypothetical protein
MAHVLLKSLMKDHLWRHRRAKTRSPHLAGALGLFAEPVAMGLEF